MPTPRKLTPIDEYELPTQARKRFLWAVGIGLALLILWLLFIWWPTPTATPTTPTTPEITRPTVTENQEPETPTAAADIRSLSALSTSINLEVIATDLESTQLDRLNAEFSAIDAILKP